MPIQSTAAPSGDASQPLSEVHSWTILIEPDGLGGFTAGLTSSLTRPVFRLSVEADPVLGLQAACQALCDLEAGWVGRCRCSDELLDLFGRANDAIAAATAGPEGGAEEDADPEDLLEPTVELDADGNLVLA